MIKAATTTSTTSTEVATVDATEKAMMVPSDVFDDGLGELDSSDLIIPRLNITQPTTPEISADQVGKFCINVTGDYTDTMTVAIIKLSKSRILFPEKYKRDNDPLCRSHNFMTPANDIEGATPMCETCGLVDGDKKKHVCSYANWGAGNEPPRCQEVWNLLIVDLETYMPMWFSLKSTALKPLRKIVSSIKMISSAKKIPMWRMKFEMSITKITNDSGTFFVPSFSGLTTMEKDDADNMDAIRGQLVGVDVKDSQEPIVNDAPAKLEDDKDF